MPIKPGRKASVELLVSEADTAIAAKSGEVPVLGTPRIVALVEEAAMASIAGELGAEQTTVSMQVQLDHLAPTAVGHTVTADATVDKVIGRRVIFTVAVNDERGLVAVGRVTRVVVDTERFLEKTT
jgi:predicted thioesterase